MKTPGGAASPSCDTCLWWGDKDTAGVPLTATRYSAPRALKRLNQQKQTAGLGERQRICPEPATRFSQRTGHATTAPGPEWRLVKLTREPVSRSLGGPSTDTGVGMGDRAAGGPSRRALVPLPKPGAGQSETDIHLGRGVLNPCCYHGVFRPLNCGNCPYRERRGQASPAVCPPVPTDATVTVSVFSPMSSWMVSPAVKFRDARSSSSAGCA
jgi:hypothetical protein